jgi:hypothetical protein
MYLSIDLNQFLSSGSCSASRYSWFMESKRSSEEVELAKRSIRVLNFVSVSLLSLIAPRKTHLQVSFCGSQTIIIMGTFNCSAGGISRRLGMSAVCLCEV